MELHYIMWQRIVLFSYRCIFQLHNIKVAMMTHFDVYIFPFQAVIFLAEAVFSQENGDSVRFSNQIPCILIKL